MRAMIRSIEEDDLQPWVDGRLTPEDAEAVEIYFAAHPELRERWSQYAEQREELRSALVGPAEKPIPARLRVARLMAAQRRRRHRQFARIAAAAALLIVGGIGRWGAHDLLPAITSSAGQFGLRRCHRGAPNLFGGNPPPGRGWRQRRGPPRAMAVETPRPPADHSRSQRARLPADGGDGCCPPTAGPPPNRDKRTTTGRQGEMR